MRIPHKCLVCKGRNCEKHCGKKDCEVCRGFRQVFETRKLVERESVSGFSPTPFIGRHNYPNINAGIMVANEEVYEKDFYDNPRGWSERGFGMVELIDIRSSLVNSRFRTNIRSSRTQEKLMELTREIGMAKSAVDVEAEFARKPRFSLNFDAYTAPHGPTARLKKAEITSNPKTDKWLERAYEDKDLKANEAARMLYEKGVDENRIARAMSVGVLGKTANRKLTPTRWSITATDDALSRGMIDKIAGFPESDPMLFFSGFLGNYYLILFYPGVWSYELFELYVPDSRKSLVYTTDYENHFGRKNYADNTAGGYYTVRLAIAEKLLKMRKRASCLAVRFITDEYAAPLGVWVTREAARKAVSGKGKSFGDENIMTSYAKAFALKKFGVNICRIIENSLVLRNRKEQSRLSSYF